MSRRYCIRYMRVAVVSPSVSLGCSAAAFCKARLLGALLQFNFSPYVLQARHNATRVVVAKGIYLVKCSFAVVRHHRMHVVRGGCSRSVVSLFPPIMVLFPSVTGCGGGGDGGGICAARRLSSQANSQAMMETI